MGFAKSLMMEMDEYDWDEVEVSFKCPICEADSTSYVELPIVYPESEIRFLPVVIPCSECEKELNATLDGGWLTCEIVLDNYQDVEVEAELTQSFADEPSIDWEDYRPDSDNSPLNVFKETVSGLKQIVDTAYNEGRSQLMLRMALVHTITALEAYLGDTLIRKVIADLEAQKRILNTAELEVGEKQFSLKKAIGINDFAKTKLIEHLKSITFHNIKKSQKLFRIGLKVNITPDETELIIINKFITIRHDCVHRNGRKKESDDYHSLTQEQIFELINAVETLVERLEDKLIVDEFS